MRVLVIGSAGMLGHITCCYLREQGHDVDDLSFPNKAFEDSCVLNLLNISELETFLSSRKYDLIINCAALLIDQSRAHCENAIFINSYIPHWLEQKFKNTKTKILQVGTDGVFNGGIPPYNENSPHLNSSIYARSKSMGELDNEKDLTVRSSYFGPDLKKEGKGLFNWFMMQDGYVGGFSDVIFSGVTSLEFAKFVNEFGIKTTGIFNLTAEEPIDKYSLLCKIKEKYKKSNIWIGKNLQKSEKMITYSSRQDIGYVQKTYDSMINELWEYMDKHKSLYTHYYK